ncbi:MAG TPA: hypothetical protein VFG36_04620 [Methanoregula sp.]|nr:hypothetical protein [Methanoregula sp.]
MTESTNDAGYAMETFSLPISALHCISLCEINVIGHPAFHAVRK